MRFVYPLIAYADGQVRAALGDPERALKDFLGAEEQAFEMRMRPMVWQARLGAAQALAALGLTDEADEKLAQARATIDEIADLFEDSDLRDKYLASAGRKLA